jgi:hypothetical protein
VTGNSEFESKYRTWHTRLSYIKSAVRIAACAIALYENSVVVIAAGILIAELVGIAEEWV